MGIPGTYVVTGHVVTGDASPAPVFELFTPFGGDASESMGNVMVTRTVPRGRITTDPVYGAKLIEIAQAGRYIIRIDGNGSTPSRTVRLALETWK